MIKDILEQLPKEFGFKGNLYMKYSNFNVEYYYSLEILCTREISIIENNSICNIIEGYIARKISLIYTLKTKSRSFSVKHLEKEIDRIYNSFEFLNYYLKLNKLI